MKYFLLTFFIVLCGELLTYAQQNFKIQGTISGYPSGEIFLINNSNPRDTLAKARVVKGKFKMKGKKGNVQVAYLRLKNAVNGPCLFLEPASFRSELKVIESHVPSSNGKLVPIQEFNDEIHSQIKGGKSQEIANQFWQLLLPVQQTFDTLQALYAKAIKNNDLSLLKQLEKKGQSLRQDVIEKAKLLISDHKDSYVPAYITLEYLLDLYEDETEAIELYTLLGPQVQISGYGKRLAKTINAGQKAPQKSTLLPNFTLSTPDNKSFSLYDVKSRVKVLDFWASYCAPCLKEMPQLLKLYNKYKSQGLEFIVITLDPDPKTTEKLQKKLKAGWINAGKFRKTDTDLEKLLNIQTIPYRMILDKNNQIIDKGNLSLEKTKEIIERLLK